MGRRFFLAFATVVLAIAAAHIKYELYFASLSPTPASLTYRLGNYAASAGTTLLLTAIASAVVAFIPSKWKGRRSTPFLICWFILVTAVEGVLVLGSYFGGQIS